eukprot:CAMPEP_0206125786 /NCGR_PEP_ID=MMETSP1472-20131121/18725_1 /ASSEMBLY_ACC=CAM_ASM_001108 /TAXON_ID=41880 /ORGANISM="Pycnococcus provasolii, Strain RCC251" /LENGTH=63 /DNA_ID=CAMNT_0053516741 /DNA_START=30 /DNA_END=218 /DNA_ORIENTATION=+
MSDSSSYTWSDSGSGNLSDIHLSAKQIEQGIDAGIDATHLAFPSTEGSVSHSGTPGTSSWQAG